jgi:hypothetical protein
MEGFRLLHNFLTIYRKITVDSFCTLASPQIALQSWHPGKDFLHFFSSILQALHHACGTTRGTT